MHIFENKEQELNYKEKIIFFNKFLNFDFYYKKNYGALILKDILNNITIYENKEYYFHKKELLIFNTRWSLLKNDIENKSKFIEFYYYVFILEIFINLLKKNIYRFEKSIKEYDKEYFKDIEAIDNIVVKYKKNFLKNKSWDNRNIKEKYEFYMLKNERDEFIENYKKQYDLNYLDFIIKQIHIVNINSCKEVYIEMINNLKELEIHSINTFNELEIFTKEIINSKII